jgi:antitoxin YefM
MRAISYTAARENLASTMNQVCDDHDPVIITRNREQAVVMVSLDDYESLQETAYLLKSPANARLLLESIEELAKGDGHVKSLTSLTA